MKPIQKHNENSSWRYRVVVEFEGHFEVHHFKFKADAEGYHGKAICNDAVLRATCDKGTVAYLRYDKDRQPDYKIGRF